MRIFLSWSGPRSRSVAEALREWLPDVIQALEPWMSAVDVDAGSRWLNDISKTLETSKSGILCVTRENPREPWLLFEAGALAKTVDRTLLCPYLLDLEPAELPAGPLAQFQAKRANAGDTRDLLRAINKALNEQALSASALDRAFERCWPSLQKALAAIPPSPKASPPKRPVEDVADEILVLVRDIASRAPASITPAPSPSYFSQGGPGDYLVHLGDSRFLVSGSEPTRLSEGFKLSDVLKSFEVKTSQSKPEGWDPPSAFGAPKTKKPPEGA